MKNYRNHLAFPAFLAINLFVADQLLKLAVEKYLQTPVTLIPNLLSLRYEQNTGIAWSIALPQIVTLVMNFILLIILPIFLIKNLNMERKASQIILGFLVGGALGNLTDRIFRGYVVDYFAVGTFPVFNLADALITLSVFLILIFYDKIIRISKKPA